MEERDHSKQFSTLRWERGISWNMWDYPWLHASLLHSALSSLQKIYPLLKKKIIQLALSRTIGGAQILLEQNTCDKMGLKQCTNMSSITFFPSSRVNALVACYRFHSIWIPNTPLSVFGDRQHVTGLPEMMIEGLWRMQNSMVNAKTSIYTGSCHYGSLIPYVQFGVMPCIRLYWMMCVQGGAPVSLYIGPEGRRTNLVLVGYNRWVLVLLLRLTFLVIRLATR